MSKVYKGVGGGEVIYFRTREMADKHCDDAGYEEIVGEWEEDDGATGDDNSIWSVAEVDAVDELNNLFQQITHHANRGSKLKSAAYHSLPKDGNGVFIREAFTASQAMLFNALLKSGDYEGVKPFSSEEISLKKEYGVTGTSEKHATEVVNKFYAALSYMEYILDDNPELPSEKTMREYISSCRDYLSQLPIYKKEM